MNATTLYLAITFLPGFLWAAINAKFGAIHKPRSIELIASAFLFGVISHIVTFFLYEIVFGIPYQIASAKNISEGFAPRQYASELLAASAVSLVLAWLWLYLSRYKFLASVLRRLKATGRYGDEDVWSFVFNSKLPTAEYVHVRDTENDLVFAGWADAFSESENYRELMLRDAIVYTGEGDTLGESPYLYISRPVDSMWIEFPYSTSQDADLKDGDR